MKLKDMIGSMASRFAAIVLALTCAGGAWGAEPTTIQNAAGEDITVHAVADGFYQNAATYSAATDFYITNLNGLKYFRDLVNAEKTVSTNYVSRFVSVGNETADAVRSWHTGKMFANKTVHLMEDINLNNEQWTPIGYSTANVKIDDVDVTVPYFVGVFDGGIYDTNNELTGVHKISNMRVIAESSTEKAYYAGLFGYCSYSGNVGIKNLAIENAYVHSASGYVGAFVASFGSGNGNHIIENCHLTGTIDIDGNHRYVGGIVGYARGKIKDCSIEGTGTISCYYSVGGITGYCGTSGSEVSGCRVSGVAVSGDLDYNVGGIAGFAENIVISNNLITAAMVNASSSGYGRVGGVVGFSSAPSATYLVVVDNVIENTTVEVNGTSIPTKIGLSQNNAIVGRDITYDGANKVTGGIFEVIPAAVIADGLTRIPNTDQATSAEYPYTVGIPQVAQIGANKYETLAEAIAAVPTTGAETTITMIANSAEPAVITVASGKNVVLDLNGKTVSYTTDAKSVYFLTNEGMLTIEDNSTNADGQVLLTAQPDTGYSTETVTIYNCGGTLTLASGTIKNATAGGLAYAVNNSSNAWGSDVVSTFNMEGGTVSAPSGDAALRVYQNTGVGWKVQSKNYVNISGGTILDTGIFFDTYLYTVNQTLPADFAANDTAVGCDIDTVVNISGGTINGLIDMKIRHPYNTRLNITGGDFANCKMWVRKVSNEYGSGLASGTLSEPTESMVYISGGKFAFVTGKAFGLSYDCGATSWTSYAKPYAVSGGVFNVEVPENACVAGKTSIANTETETKDAYPYTVGMAVAQIGDTKYETLAKAFAAANEAGEAVTITMLADSELVGNIGYTVNADSDITLDLNGYTLSQTQPDAATGYFIENRGTLTIQDSTDTAKNGTGTGKITVTATNPDAKSSPTYANNLITNRGTLTIESGCYKSLTTDGPACYVVDNYSGGTANITGGKLTNDRSYAVRMFLASTADNNALNISGGILAGRYAVWMQFANSNANKATLNISGGTISATGGFAVYANAAGNSTRDASNVEVSFSGDVDVGGTGVWLASDVAYKSISVTGGTYAGFGSSPVNEGFIAGGTFESLSLFSQGRTDFTTVLADGYVLKDNQDGTYGVKEGTYVAQILENGYVNISAPINEASDDVYIETANNYYFQGRDRTLVDEDGNTCPAYLATTDETVYYFYVNETKYGISAKYIFETCYLGEDYKYQTSELFEIVPAVKARYETLAEALAAAEAGETVELLTDIVLDSVVLIDKSIVIDGDGHEVSTSTANRIFRITAPSLSVLFENISMVSTYSGDDARGISFDDVSDGSKLHLKNASLSAPYYAINAIIGADNIEVVIEDSTAVAGWAAINCYSLNSTFTITDSTLKGVNDKPYNADGWNNFATIVFDGHNSGYGSGNTVTLNNSTVQSEATTGNIQQWLSVQYGARNNTIICTGDTSIEQISGGEVVSNDLINFNISDLQTTITVPASMFEGIADADAALRAKCAARSDNNDGTYTISLSPEILYYWATGSGYSGGYYAFNDPFDNGWLADGEYVALQKNVALTKDLSTDKSFTLLLGEYTLSPGEYSITLADGATVTSDRSGIGDLFSAPSQNHEIRETATEDGKFAYTFVIPEYQVTFSQIEDADVEVSAMPENFSFAKGSGEIALQKPTYTSSSKTFAGWKVEDSDPEVILSAIPAGATEDYTLVATWASAQVVSVTEDAKTATIKVTDAWVKANVTPTGDAAPGEIKAALEETDSNGLKKWENYVLGQTPSAKLTADVEQGAITAMPVTSSATTPALDTGFKVQYRLDTVASTGEIVTQGTKQDSDILPLDVSAMADGEAKYYKTTAVITSTDNSGVSVEVPSDNTIGVLAVAPATRTAIIAVPWAALDGTGDISVENIVRTATLTEGDTLQAYDSTTKTYKAWTLGSNGQWEASSVTSTSGTDAGEDADAFTVPRGAAVWLTRSDATKPIYLVGAVGSGSVSTSLEAGTTAKPSWNLVGNPTVEAKSVEKFANEGDQIIIPTAYAPKNISCNNGTWGYWTTEDVMENDVKVGVRSVWKTDDVAIPAGTGFWYLNAGDQKEVSWSDESASNL